MIRNALFAVAMCFCLCSLLHAQTTTRAELGGVRHAGPGGLVNPSNATYAIGMSLDGNQTFMGTAKVTDTVQISGIIRPESGHIGQVADIFVVDRLTLTSFMMLNKNGVFVSWDVVVSNLVPYMENQVLTAEFPVNIFTGKLGVTGVHRLFLGYKPPDGILRYTATPHQVTITLPPLDTDQDGMPDTSDTDDDNDNVSDTLDLFPLNAARTIAIAPAFPKVNDRYQLPDYPSTRQLTWVLAQLASGSSTSLEEINSHFSPKALSTTSAVQWQQFFQTVRAASPGAIVVEVIAATPMQVTAMIGTPGVNASGRYLDLSTKYATGLIESVTAAAYPLDSSVSYVQDRTLTLAQAADRFTQLAAGTSLLVARIDNNQCVPIEQRNGDTPRATGSLFKTWLLGALGQAINDGVVSAAGSLPLVAAEIVTRGSALATEPLGTIIPLPHMAAMMMGNSDNTATDHIHQLVGRARAEAILAQFNNTHSGLLTPFLSANEQFKLFGGVSLAQAEAWVTSTEQQQRTFLETVLEAPGSLTGIPNASIFITGSWQASPMDVCNAMAGMRRFNDQSAGFRMMDIAYSSGGAQPFVRNRWERVWYKGGNLALASGDMVLTHSWLLESDARGAFAVIALANNQAGGIDGFQVQSVLARILTLVDQANP